MSKALQTASQPKMNKPRKCRCGTLTYAVYGERRVPICANCFERRLKNGFDFSV